MNVAETVEAEVTPDIDSVRHLNQFGTPDVPLMEVACTQDRKDMVIQFFKDSQIEVWPDSINPLVAPDIDPRDDSLTVTKRHHSHCIRILNAWWKVAHYVQNSYIAAYYMKLTTQAVRNTVAPYNWPKHIIGISIDARGVHNPKDSPKIDFEYVQGFEAPEYNKNNNARSVTVRSLATGRTLPPVKAVKRLRTDGQVTAPAAGTAEEGNQCGTQIMTVGDITTPAPSNARNLTIPLTPAASTTGTAAAGSSSAESPPYRPAAADLGTCTPARELSFHYGDANPPPPTPRTPASAHIQMSQSGRKLPAQGPRSGSRNSGVEQY